MYYLAYCSKDTPVPSLDPDELEQLARNLQQQQDEKNGRKRSTKSSLSRRKSSCTSSSSSPSAKAATLRIPKPPSPKSSRYYADGTTVTTDRVGATGVANYKTRPSSALHRPPRSAFSVRTRVAGAKKSSPSSRTSSPSTSPSLDKELAIRGGRSSVALHILEDDGKSRPASATGWMRRAVHSGRATITAGTIPHATFSSAPGSIKANGFTCGLCYNKYGAPLVRDALRQQQQSEQQSEHQRQNLPQTGGSDIAAGKRDGEGREGGGRGGDGVMRGSSASSSSASFRRKTLQAGAVGGASFYDENNPAVQALEHVATPAALLSMRAVIAVRRRFARRAKQQQAQSSSSRSSSPRLTSPSLLTGHRQHRHRDGDHGNDDDEGDEDNEFAGLSSSSSSSSSCDDDNDKNDRQNVKNSYHRRSSKVNVNNRSRSSSSRKLEPPSLSVHGAPLYSGRVNKSRLEDLLAAQSAVQFGYESVAICRFCAQFFGIFLGHRYDEGEENRRDVARAKKMLHEQRRLRETAQTDQQQQKLITATTMMEELEDFVPGYVDDDVERDRQEQRERIRLLREKQIKAKEKCLATLFETNNVFRSKNAEHFDKTIGKKNRRRIDAAVRDEQAQARRSSILSGTLASTIRSAESDLQVDDRNQSKKSVFSSPTSPKYGKDGSFGNVVAASASKLCLQRRDSEIGAQRSTKELGQQKEQQAKKCVGDYDEEDEREGARTKHERAAVVVGSHTRERASAHFMSLKRRAENSGFAVLAATRKRKVKANERKQKHEPVVDDVAAVCHDVNNNKENDINGDEKSSISRTESRLSHTSSLAWDFTEFQHEVIAKQDEKARSKKRDALKRDNNNNKVDEEESRVTSADYFVIDDSVEKRRSTKIELDDERDLVEDEVTDDDVDDVEHDTNDDNNSHNNHINGREDVKPKMNKSLKQRRGTKLSISESSSSSASLDNESDKQPRKQNDQTGHKEPPQEKKQQVPMPRRGTKLSLSESSTNSSSSSHSAVSGIPTAATKESSEVKTSKALAFDQSLDQNLQQFDQYFSPNSARQELQPTHSFASVGLFCATNLGSCVAPTSVSSLLPRIIDASVVECVRVHRFDMSMTSLTTTSSRSPSSSPSATIPPASPSSTTDDFQILRSWKEKCVDPFRSSYLLQEEQRRNAWATLDANAPSPELARRTSQALVPPAPRGMHVVWILASCRLTSSTCCCLKTKKTIVAKLVKGHEKRKAANSTASSSSARKKENTKKFVVDQDEIFPASSYSKYSRATSDCDDDDDDKMFLEAGDEAFASSTSSSHRQRMNITVDGLPADFCLSCFLMKVAGEAAAKDSDVTFVFDLGGAACSTSSSSSSPLILEMWKHSLFSFTNVAGVVVAGAKSKSKHSSNDDGNNNNNNNNNNNKALLGSVTSSLLLDHFNEPPIRRSPLRAIQELFLATSRKKQRILQRTSVVMYFPRYRDATTTGLAGNSSSSSTQHRKSLFFSSNLDDEDFDNDNDNDEFKSGPKQRHRRLRTPFVLFSQFAGEGSDQLINLTVARPSRALMLPHTLLGSALKFVPVRESAAAAAAATTTNGSTKVVGVAVILRPEVSYEHVTLRHAANIQRSLLQQQFGGSGSTDSEWIARISGTLDGRVFVFLMVDLAKIRENEEKEVEREDDEGQGEKMERQQQPREREKQKVDDEKKQQQQQQQHQSSSNKPKSSFDLHLPAPPPRPTSAVRPPGGTSRSTSPTTPTTSVGTSPSTTTIKTTQQHQSSSSLQPNNVRARRILQQESPQELQTRLTLTAGHVLKRRLNDGRFKAVAGFSVSDVQIVVQEQRKKQIVDEIARTDKKLSYLDHKLNETETMEVIVGEILTNCCACLALPSREKGSEKMTFVDFLPG